VYSNIYSVGLSLFSRFINQLNSILDPQPSIRQNYHLSHLATLIHAGIMIVIAVDYMWKGFKFRVEIGDSMKYTFISGPINKEAADIISMKEKLQTILL
jgi:hypothetical protein